jgi:pantoate--beta-alanine ligase
MQIHHTINSLQQALDAQPQATVALVPTMGNLHAGHLQLVQEARQHADLIVVSIFVNPMQFGRNEDLDSYPRTLQADTEQLQQNDCDHVFAPAPSEIYPRGLAAQTVVSVPALTRLHCGASRPGHFDGVSTVVSKLFNIVRPHTAIFGLKDYQQFAVIRKMVLDLNYPIRLIGVETWREASGLAMSSRNGYLSPQQKQTAAQLFQCLQRTRDEIMAGAIDFAALEEQAKRDIEGNGMKVDYFTVANAETLEAATADDRELVILLAAFCGTTRLIDNIRVSR